MCRIIATSDCVSKCEVDVVCFPNRVALDRSVSGRQLPNGAYVPRGYVACLLTCLLYCLLAPLLALLLQSKFYLRSHLGSEGYPSDLVFFCCVLGASARCWGFCSLSRASAVFASFCCIRELLLYSRASAIFASFCCIRELLLYS